MISVTQPKRTGGFQEYTAGLFHPLFPNGASLVAQTVKNLPAMQETWVPSLGREDPLEKGTVTHSSSLAWRIPRDRGAWKAIWSMGSQMSPTQEGLASSKPVETEATHPSLSLGFFISAPFI